MGGGLEVYGGCLEEGPGKHVYVCGCSCEAGGEGGKSVLPAELLPKSNTHIRQAHGLYKPESTISQRWMSQGQ